MPPQAKPTAIHYAFVVAVLLIVVCALSWLIEHQQRVEVRTRNRTLAAELGALREELALCQKQADEEKKRAEARLRTLEAVNDAGKVALLAVDQALRADVILPGAAPGEGAEANAGGARAGQIPLVISVASTESGEIEWLDTGLAKLFDGPLNEDRLRLLDRRLNDIFAIAEPPFDGIVLRVGKDLRYDELLRIIQVCARQAPRDDSGRNKIAFSELLHE